MSPRLWFILAVICILRTSASAEDNESKIRLRVVPFFEESDHDNPPPEWIEIDAAQAALVSLQERFAKQNAPKKKFESTLEAVLDTPERFWYSKAAWEDHFDTSALKSALQSNLDDATTEHKKHYARILAQLGDQKAFDWALSQLPKDPHTQIPNQDLFFLFSLDESKQDWISSDAVWTLIKTHLSTNYQMRSLGKRFCKEQLADWYLSKLDDQDLSHYEVSSLLQELASFAPTPQVLRSAQPFFTKTPDTNEEWVQVFGLYAVLQSFANSTIPSAGERKEIGKIICEISLPLAKDDHWVCGHFHRLICKFGDEEWFDYFNACVAKRKLRYHAFEALVRLQVGSKREFLQGYLDFWEDSPVEIREQALSILCVELVGSRDEQLSKWLVRQINRTQEDSIREKRLRQLSLLGCDELVKPLLAQYFPVPEGRSAATTLLELLQNHELAQELTESEIRERIVPQVADETRPSELMIPYAERIEATLELAGLYSEVDSVVEVQYQFETLGKISRAEFKPENLCIDVAGNTIQFAVEQGVVEYKVTYVEEYQDPFSIAAIANTLLRHSDNPNRFIPYNNYEGMTDVWFYFGTQELASKLEIGYEVDFVPDWKKQF
ncbi:MAG: hypothetical protein AAF483_03455 [Planctomycetota bacterium]